MIEVASLHSNFSTTRLVVSRPLEAGKPLFLLGGDGRKGEGGLRTGNCYKHSYKRQSNQWIISDESNAQGTPIELTVDFIGDYLPLITVVTVVFNGEQFLEETIRSIICQPYPNIEYIVIDGGSTDGTLEIIRKYEHAIDYWVSENDGGIYDAMNKGIEIAAGQWINFMNAGDAFICDVGVVHSYDYSKTPMVYGDAIVKDEDGKTLYKSGREVIAEDFYKSMPICHQAIFFSKRFIRLYDNRFRVIADRVMTYALMTGDFQSKYDDRIQVKYIEGGVSNRLRSRRLREELDFLKECGRLTLLALLVLHFKSHIVGPLYDSLKAVGLIKIYRALKYEN